MELTRMFRNSDSERRKEIQLLKKPLLWHGMPMRSVQWLLPLKEKVYKREKQLTKKDNQLIKKDMALFEKSALSETRNSRYNVKRASIVSSFLSFTRVHDNTDFQQRAFYRPRPWSFCCEF
jgi:hypothetical protein